MNSGDDENARREISASTFLICGSCFQNASRTAAKNFAAAQFRGVLEHRRGRLVVQFRAVAEYDQRRIGNISRSPAQVDAADAPTASRVHLAQLF